MQCGIDSPLWQVERLTALVSNLLDDRVSWFSCPLGHATSAIDRQFDWLAEGIGERLNGRRAENHTRVPPNALAYKIAFADFPAENPGKPKIVC
jgi:hypothetical protein